MCDYLLKIDEKNNLKLSKKLNMLNKLENKIKYIFRYKIVHSEIIYSVYKF